MGFLAARHVLRMHSWPTTCEGQIWIRASCSFLLFLLFIGTLDSFIGQICSTLGNSSCPINQPNICGKPLIVILRFQKQAEEKIPTFTNTQTMSYAKVTKISLCVASKFQRRWGQDWTLFCPNEAFDTETGKGLMDLWGEDFERPTVWPWWGWSQCHRPSRNGVLPTISGEILDGLLIFLAIFTQFFVLLDL